MSTWSHETLTHLARRGALLGALIAEAIAVVTLAGWIAGTPDVARLAPGSLALKPNTAIALLLLAFAGAANAAPPRRRAVARAARWSGAAGLLLVAVISSQWVLGKDLGIDELVLRDSLSQNAPGRPAPVTCILLLLVGVGLQLDRRPAIDGRLVNGMALAPLVVGLFEVVGFVGGLGTVTDEHGVLRMSIGGAVATVLLAASLLCARPSRGGVRLLVSPRAGGVVARRLVPIALGAPIALNALRAEATAEGLMSERTGVWLYAFLVLMSFAVVVLLLGRRLERGDVAREATEARLHGLLEQEHDRISGVVAAQTAISGGSGRLLETMELVGANAAAIVGADGAVVEMVDGDDLVYRAVVGTSGGQVGLRVPIAGSLAGIALRTGKTQHSLDTETDARVDCEVTRRVGTRSMICVPLRHRDEVVAVLKVVASTPGRFDERHERTLELLAGLAASAVHRAQDERRLAAHRAVAEALAGAHGIADGLEGALRGIGEALGWAAGGVWLTDGEGDRTVEPAARWALPGIAEAEEFGGLMAAPAAGGGVAIVEAVLDGAAARWVDDLTALDGGGALVSTGRARSAAALGLRSAVAVPIVLHGRAVGVLELASHGRRTREAAELELLTATAAQIGQFVERHRAEERVARHAENLGAVAGLSAQLGRSQDHRVLRPVLASAIRELAGADQVILLEPDGAGGLAVTAESGGLLPVGFTIELRAGAAVAADVFQAGEGRFVADLAAEASASRAVLARTALQSAHYEPVVRDGAVVGVLVVAVRRRSSRDARGLGSLMRLLAAEAAGALALADALASLEDRARTDVLTGAANRRTWDEELPRELARAARTGTAISVAIIDLDHFKAYNDTFGHPAGDRLLRAAAAGWVTRLRATDVLARYGGEEFAVVLPGCDAEAAIAVAEALREAVPGEATCSIGVACWDGAESADALVARADAALYGAKHAGRDRVVAAA